MVFLMSTTLKDHYTIITNEKLQDIFGNIDLL